MRQVNYIMSPNVILMSVILDVMSPVDGVRLTKLLLNISPLCLSICNEETGCIFFKFSFQITLKSHSVIEFWLHLVPNRTIDEVLQRQGNDGQGITLSRTRLEGGAQKGQEILFGIQWKRFHQYAGWLNLTVSSRLPSGKIDWGFLFSNPTNNIRLVLCGNMSVCVFD